MKVRFLKLCRWSFKNKVTEFKEGMIREVTDSDAAEMIRCGYAAKEIENESPDESSVFSETENAENELDAEKRRAFYKELYSKKELRDLCERHKLIIESRTIDAYIDAIVSFEKENGIIEEKKDDVSRA